MRKRKIERVKRARATGSKVEQHRDTMVTDTTASSLAKETRGSSVTSTNRACSNGRGRKNKCEDSMPKSAGSVYISKPIYDGCR